MDAQSLLYPSTTGGAQRYVLYDLQLEADKTHVKDLRREHHSLTERCPNHPLLLHIQAVEADTLQCLLAASHANWGDMHGTPHGDASKSWKETRRIGGSLSGNSSASGDLVDHRLPHCFHSSPMTWQRRSTPSWTSTHPNP